MTDQPGSPSAQPVSLSDDTQGESAPAIAEHPTAKRFTSCRWHETQDGGAAYCSHRDVLPYAGMNGFKPEAWCPECAFYKARRTVKKRSLNGDTTSDASR